MRLYGSYAEVTFNKGYDIDLLLGFFEGVMNTKQTTLIDKFKKHV